LRKSPWSCILVPKQYSVSSARPCEFPARYHPISQSCAVSTEDPSSPPIPEPNTVDNNVMALTRVSTEYSTSVFACASLETQRDFPHTRQSYRRRQAERYQESSRLDAFRGEIANGRDH